jgi:DNA-binding HxlR family transcriptional regulator
MVYHRCVRSYSQYCALAKALDVIGDRWTMLIARELLLGSSRYGELQEGLPGIPTNLLAARLRQLEEDGVVVRDDQGLYALTPWGQHLAEPLAALIRWGSPLMKEMASSDSFRSRWLIGPVSLIFGGVDTDRPPFVAELRAGDAPVTMESAGGEVRFRPGPAVAPDLVLTGAPDVIVGILSGRLDKKAAEDRGASVLGDLGPLSHLRRDDWLSGPEACSTDRMASASRISEKGDTGKQR